MRPIFKYLIKKNVAKTTVKCQAHTIKVKLNRWSSLYYNLKNICINILFKNQVCARMCVTQI